MRSQHKTLIPMADAQKWYSIDCPHPQCRAPGSGSPVALRHCSFNFRQLWFSTLCFWLIPKRSWNVMAVPAQQPRVCSTKLRARFAPWGMVWGHQGFIQRCAAFPKAQEDHESKGRQWQSGFVLCTAFQESFLAHSISAVHGHRLTRGWLGAEADLGTLSARQWG